MNETIDRQIARLQKAVDEAFSDVHADFGDDIEPGWEIDVTRSVLGGEEADEEAKAEVFRMMFGLRLDGEPLWGDDDWD